MIRDFVERTLHKVFATHAREPDPARMTSTERREAAETMEPKGHPMVSSTADDSSEARKEAKAATEPPPPADAPFADDTKGARDHARQASEKDGSHLESEVVTDYPSAAAEARDVSPHEPPRSEPVDDSDTAREDIERANQKGGA